MSYFRVIEEFKLKLPRTQNQAKQFTEQEIEDNPYLSDSFKQVAVLNLSPYKVSVTEADIDLFYNKLNHFDFSFVLFKDYYRGITSNLNRFKPKAKDGNFDLAVVQKLLTEDNFTSMKPLKPIPVLLYHLKYKYKWTSKVYEFFVLHF